MIDQDVLSSGSCSFLDGVLLVATGEKKTLVAEIGTFNNMGLCAIFVEMNGIVQVMLVRQSHIVSLSICVHGSSLFLVILKYIV